MITVSYLAGVFRLDALHAQAKYWLPQLISQAPTWTVHMP